MNRVFFNALQAAVLPVVEELNACQGASKTEFY
jgi:hypothetical protein